MTKQAEDLDMARGVENTHRPYLGGEGRHSESEARVDCDLLPPHCYSYFNEP